MAGSKSNMNTSGSANVDFEKLYNELKRNYDIARRNVALASESEEKYYKKWQNEISNRQISEHNENKAKSELERKTLQLDRLIVRHNSLQLRFSKTPISWLLNKLHL